MKKIVFILLMFWVGVTNVEAQDIERNFAGSVQLDYLGVLTEDVGREQGLDGGTAEVSLKLAVDFNETMSANVKVCVSCHGMEVGMAFVDTRTSDLLNFRVGRFTPQFGNFPLRHDPANHRTSDKPLPYDMGRMLRTQEFNMSILPTPWVDNGIEVSGTHFGSDTTRIDYAAYLIGGPKGNSDGADFDFIQSRSRDRYYVDNNSRPSVGARLAGSLDYSDDLTFSLGTSMMAGHYDPDNELSYFLGGLDFIMQYKRLFWRSEYLIRRTEMFIGDDPASRFKYGPGADGTYSNYFLKDGFYSEVEFPINDTIDFIGRFDGMRRYGNVLASSPLRSRSAVFRYTGGITYGFDSGIRLKTSLELYDFSDFQDEVATHVGLAGSF